MAAILKRPFNLLTLVAVGLVLNLSISWMAWGQTRPALVRDVDNGAWQPFNSCAHVDDTWHAVFQDILTVPPGKRAVIEYVSFMSATDTEIRYVYTYLYNSEVLSKHYLAVTPHGGAGGRTNYVGNSSMKMYADQGWSVSFSAWRAEGYTQLFSAEMCVSGHYVDITQ